MLILYRTEQEKGGGGEKNKTTKQNKSLSQAVGTGLGGVLWVYKVGIKWPDIAMAISQKPV